MKLTHYEDKQERWKSKPIQQNGIITEKADLRRGLTNAIFNFTRNMKPIAEHYERYGNLNIILFESYNNNWKLQILLYYYYYYK